MVALAMVVGVAACRSPDCTLTRPDQEKAQGSATRPTEASRARLAAGRVETAKETISAIDAALELYYIEKRRIAALEDLVTADQKGQRYLEGFSDVPTDPWGSPYEIRMGKHPGSWEVLSYGPDAMPDTEDDISSKTLTMKPSKKYESKPVPVRKHK